MAYQVLFDGTVTTIDDNGEIITTESAIAADTIIVTFNGTEYECQNISSEGGYQYGAPDSGSFDFSVFPFNIRVDPNNSTSATVRTETAGTYTVKIEVAVKTIMHSPLTRDSRFELVFESDDMPTTANGWEVVSGNTAKEYMQDLSTDSDHEGTIGTDSRFKYFFQNSSAR